MYFKSLKVLSIVYYCKMCFILGSIVDLWAMGANEVSEVQRSASFLSLLSLDEVCGSNYVLVH